MLLLTLSFERGCVGKRITLSGGRQIKLFLEGHRFLNQRALALVFDSLLVLPNDESRVIAALWANIVIDGYDA